jgi:CRISPR-associated protein Cas5t
MHVTRVVVEAPVTSFRHPFFVTGRQPTFDFPPPSTIFGHCASALGKWPDATTFFFGLHFTSQARTGDLEHQHITTALAPKTKTMVSTKDGPARATTEVTVQPVRRDFLFGARMTLYLPPEIGAAFRAPVHTVVLGRSQDLAEIVEVKEVVLEKPGRARIEHTLLPRTLRPCVRFGTTVLLTRHISEPPTREASFAQYIALREHVHLGEGADPNRAFVRVDNIPLDDLWVDTAHVDDDGFPRGVWIHRLTDPS